MNVEVLYLNEAGECLADVAPVKFIAPAPGTAYYATKCDSSELTDEDFVQDNIVATCELMLTSNGEKKFTLLIQDDKQQPLFKVDCSKAKLTGSTYSASLPLIDDTTSDHFKAFTSTLVNLVADMYRNLATARAMAGTASAMKAALGIGSAMPTATSASEDDIIDAIKRHTKADIVKPKETLADYVCTPKLMEELKEIIDLFDNSAYYKSLGLNLPKGILLKGPPGTGKTFAAKCIAGTTNAWFMTCTASSLQGQYIGSGTQNIKDVFEGARMLADKTKKGVIIFMDEIDSLGSRDSHGGGAGSEEDRTVNQLLAEMSGFDAGDLNIMVIGATNYAQRLDDALLRSGRFGRQITIDYPDEHERIELIKHYYSKITLPREAAADDAVLSDIMDGLTPADIAEVANESGILTVRHKNKEITLDDINETINRTLTKNVRSEDGPAKMVELISAHEAGHVVVEMLHEKRTPIKVTSYGYGSAGGFTQSAKPQSGLTSKAKYLARVKTLLGGRMAEQIVCGYITTGASNDLMRAKAMIKDYYTVYNFEPYEVKDIDQIVEDKLNNIYNGLLKEFNMNADLEKWLKEVTDKLIKERVVYKADLIGLVPSKYMKGLVTIC